MDNIEKFLRAGEMSQSAENPAVVKGNQAHVWGFLVSSRS